MGKTDAVGRPEFLEAMRGVAAVCDYEPVSIIAPFIDVSKTEIARIGGRLGIDYSQTWSCYKGGDLHCGKCGTCVERIEAIRDAGLEDPTEYEA